MNKVILVGNLTKDPELVTTNNGISLCRFTLAVQRRFTSGDGEREADFINVVVWRGQADNCYKYLKKGSKAGVCGSIQTRASDFPEDFEPEAVGSSEFDEPLLERNSTSSATTSVAYFLVPSVPSYALV